MRQGAPFSSILLCGLLAVAACAPAGPPADRRTRQIAAAEAKIRTDVGDPNALFTKVQLTGDDKTGQTCGVVQPGSNAPRRFIVYIDNTAGPWVDQGGGHVPISADAFETAWRNDCLNEGYSQ